MGKEKALNDTSHDDQLVNPNIMINEISTHFFDLASPSNSTS
jgi:hypothetical protein